MLLCDTLCFQTPLRTTLWARQYYSHCTDRALEALKSFCLFSPPPFLTSCLFPLLSLFPKRIEPEFGCRILDSKSNVLYTWSSSFIWYNERWKIWKWILILSLLVLKYQFFCIGMTQKYNSYCSCLGKKTSSVPFAVPGLYFRYYLIVKLRFEHIVIII